MATKDILIRTRPTGNPSIQFSGSAYSSIALEVLESGSVSFMGSSGSLFSISDSLVGSLMSVNDISGLPILEVFDTDKVVMGTYGQNTLVVTGSYIGIGTSVPAYPLHIKSSVANAATMIAIEDDNGTVIHKLGKDPSDHSSYSMYNGSGTLVNYLFTNGDSYFNGGDVIIGATSPDAKFHVHGSTGFRLTDSNQNANEYAEIRYDNAGVTNLYINSDYTNSNALINFQLAASTKMAIRGDGYVGIGTDGPAAMLHLQSTSTSWIHVENTGAAQARIKLDGNRTGVDENIGYLEGLWDGTSIAEIRFMSGQDAVNKDEGWLDFYTAPPGGTPVSRMAIREDGNVGIGTQDPVGNLHINDASSTADLYLDSYDNNNASIIHFNRANITTDTARIVATHNDGTAQQNSLEFLTGLDESTIKMIILEGGNVGIGTNAPDEKFEVEGGNVRFDASAYKLFLYPTNDNNYINYYSWIANTGNVHTMQNNGAGGIAINAGSTGNVVLATTAGNIQLNGGNVGIGTTTVTYTLTLENSTTSWLSRLYGTGDGEGLLIRAGSTGTKRAFQVATSADVKLMTVLASGDVGIGTDSPNSLLHIYGANNAVSDDYSHLYIQGVGSYPSTMAGIVLDSDGSDQTHIRFSNAGSPKFQIRYNAGDTTVDTLKVYSFTQGADMMTWDGTTGYVGIGTTNPTRLLDVEGDQNSALIAAEFVNKNTGTSAYAEVNLKSSTATLRLGVTDPSYTNWTGGSFIYSTAGSGRLALGAGDSEKLTILPSGYVGIGVSAPNYTLSIVDGGIAGSQTFASGFAGNGWVIDDSSGASATFDNLTVRGTMSIYELLINQVRATNGSLWVSSTGKPTSVTGGPTFTLTFDTGGTSGHGFAQYDLIRAQRWDAASNSLYQSNLSVATVTGNTSLTATKISGDDPLAGMEFVRIGNTTDTDRQGAVYLTADDDGAPFIDIIDGVAAFSDFNTSDVSKVRLGKLDGITSPIFGVLDGYGLYSQNMYLEGNAQIAGTLTAGDANGVGASFYAGKIHRNELQFASQNYIGWSAEAAVWTAATANLPAPDETNTAVSYTTISTAGNYLYKYIDTTGYTIGDTLTFSCWIKADVPSSIKMYFDINATPGYSGTTNDVSTEWTRIKTTATLTALGASNLCGFGNPGHTTTYYFWGFQLEEASEPTAYQETDGTNSGTGYGMWAKQGGFGGTMQNPIVSLQEYGLKVINGGTAGTLASNTIMIGNITPGSAVSALMLTNTGTAASSGLFGYDGSGNEVIKLALDGNHELAGWTLNYDMIANGPVSMSYADKAFIINNGDVANKVRMGYLTGKFGTPADTYGFILGTGLSDSSADDVMVELSDNRNYISGWTVTSGSLYNTNARLYGVGILSLGSANGWATDQCTFIDGNNSRMSIGTGFRYDPASSPALVVDGDAEIAGWSISTTSLSKGAITVQAVTNNSFFGVNATAYGGTGIWIGQNGASSYQMSAVSTAGKFLWNGTKLEIQGADATSVFETTATGAVIGGWTLDATTISSTNITIDSGNEKIYMGTGTYGNTNTPVFLGRDGGISKFSLSDALTFDGTDLTVAGTVYASAGSFTGNISAGSGNIGNWNIVSGELSSGTDIVLDATNKRISLAGATMLFGYGVGASAEHGIVIDSSNYWYSNGKFSMGSGNVTWDGATLSVTGEITATTGTIGGFTIGTNLTTLTKAAWNDGNAGVFIGSTGIGLGAVSTGFSVSAAGALTATSATITGTINASAGFIGGAASGWAIGSALLSGGSGATYIALDQTNSKIRIGAKASLTDANTGVHLGSDGIALGASSVFKVTNAGVLTATSATITGAITATSGTFTGTIDASGGDFTGYVNAGNVKFGVNAGGASKNGIYMDAYNYWYDASGFAFKLGGATNYISGNGSTISIKTTSLDLQSTNFTVTTGGTITAVDGTIGGWTLAANEIFSGDIHIDQSSNSIYIDSGSRKVVDVHTGPFDTNTEITELLGDPSFETGTTGWTLAGTLMTVARVADADAYAGSYSVTGSDVAGNPYTRPSSSIEYTKTGITGLSIGDVATYKVAVKHSVRPGTEPVPTWATLMLEGYAGSWSTLKTKSSGIAFDVWSVMSDTFTLESAAYTQFRFTAMLHGYSKNYYTSLEYSLDDASLAVYNGGNITELCEDGLLIFKDYDNIINFGINDASVSFNAATINELTSTVVMSPTVNASLLKANSNLTITTNTGSIAPIISVLGATGLDSDTNSVFYSGSLVNIQGGTGGKGNESVLASRQSGSFGGTVSIIGGTGGWGGDVTNSSVAGAGGIGGDVNIWSGLGGLDGRGNTGQYLAPETYRSGDINLMVNTKSGYEHWAKVVYGSINLGINNVNGLTVYTADEDTDTPSVYIGIGTEAPSLFLDIEDGSGTGLLELTNPDSGGNSFIFGVSDTATTTYGTAGSLFIRDGASSRFVIESGGNVGIGTTNPTQKLQVQGDLYVSADIHLIDRLCLGSTDNNTYIDYRATDNIDIVAGGVNGITIESGGNVGLGGQTNPAVELDVSGQMLVSYSNVADANNVTTGYTANIGSLYIRQKGAYAGISGQNYPNQILSATAAGPLEIYTQGADNITMGANSTPIMTLESGGNVGIGTTDPTHLLYITKDGDADMKLVQYQTSTTGPNFVFERAKGTAASPSNSSTNDWIGNIQFSSYSSGFTAVAGISCMLDSTTGPAGRLEFKTKNTGGTYGIRGEFDGAGKFWAYGALDVSGTLSKGAGSFKIKHPNPEKTGELYHSFVESPTAGDNLYRYQVDITGSYHEIELPEYYQHLNKDDMVWVNPVKHFGKAYGDVNSEQTKIEIHVDSPGVYNVLLIGTRKDEVAQKFLGIYEGWDETIESEDDS